MSKKWLLLHFTLVHKEQFQLYFQLTKSIVQLNF